ncbi:AraC family transcriptional regulator [Flavobacterium anhuiense]|uniref:helix-turn-helix domain-containing protein n=1 Tax=Flavobacterium anhuiense TaxID=459526 RepID=UPI003D996F0E
MGETEKQATLIAPKFVRNHYQGNDSQGEALVSDHIFSYIISGSHEVWIGDQKFTFKAGDCRFFKRNQLAKYIKRTESDGFKSLAFHIDQHTLQEIAKESHIKTRDRYGGEAVKLVKENALLQNFISGIMPYYESGKLDEEMLKLKTKELVLILADLDFDLKHMLFEFSNPGKLDLEAFMNGHYRYNISLERFAFLTGRSLSAFKRDFAVLFNATPGRWLVKKRLQEARFLIEQQLQRPSEIYLELGFADLSHFSHAYKKAFGKAPSKQ